MPPTSGLRITLHQNHRRLTRPRLIVLEVVKQAKSHLTPAAIYERARVKDPHIGMTTVYRSLTLLIQLGYVQRIHLARGCHSYAPNEQVHSHHLVCSECGRTEEFADCDLELLIKTLRMKTGYTIEAHVLELIGRCPSCQSKGHTPKCKEERISHKPWSP